MGKKRITEEEKNEFFNPMQGGVMWTEKYNETLDKLWSKLPDYFGKCLATMAIFTLGITMRGDWVIVLVHFLKQIKISNADFTVEETLEYLYLKNFGFIWIAATIVSYAMYFLIGGFLHWYFYVKQRDQAKTWKCQPNKWMSPDLERHEIIFGSITLLIVSSFSAVLACYIINGGWCMVYYQFDEYGWWWFLLQWPIIFIYQDYSTYWLHRLYHFPWLYKHFHKMHHKYKQPTAFSVTAIHPIEILHVQFTLCAPLFIIPIHWVSFYVIALYTYYHGIIDHSGINFKAYWWQPWQPDAIFHDNHHQYFHVNFGFNIFIWDKIHGTYRRKDRVYTENIFYGFGKSIKEVTKEELNADIEERNSENPLAHRNNKLEYKLTQDDLKFSY